MRLGAGGRGLAVNGRFAAMRTFDRAAVFDLEARTRVTSVKIASDPASSPGPVGVTASGVLLHVDPAGRLRAAGTVRMRGIEDIVAVVGERALRRAADRDHAVQLARPPVVARPRERRGEAAHRRARHRPVPDRRHAAALHPPPAASRYGDLPAEAPQTTPACPRERLSFDVNEAQRRPRVRMWVSCPGASGDAPCTGTARLTAKGRRRALGTWRFRASGGSRATRVLRVRRPPRRARLRITATDGTRITRRIVFLR